MSATRLTWLDANRVCAALGVVMIHSSTDPAGRPWADAPPDQRIIPAVLRALAEFAGSEIFIVFSLFLIASRLDRRHISYPDMLQDQAKRLLIPFLAWSVFYAFFRLLKANAFGYDAAIVEQLKSFGSWAKYILLGSSQYHMHFLPTLYGIILLFPVMTVARRFPLAGLLLLPLLYLMDGIQGWLWGHVADVDLRDYLLRLSKIACYTGYGFAAFSFFALWKQGYDRPTSLMLLRLFLLLIVVCFFIKLTYWLDYAAQAQKYLPRKGAVFYSHFLMSTLVFGAFLSMQHFNFSHRFTYFARFTFGVYLLHPAVIDLYDIGAHEMGWQWSPTATVLSKYLFAVPVTFAVCYLISKTRPIAWTIGLGPLPFSHPKAHLETPASKNG